MVLKSVESIQVASIRDQLPNYPGVGQLFEELLQYLQHQGVKPGRYCTAIWHDPEYKPENVDGEAVMAIEGIVSGNDRVQVKELPGWNTMACLIHHGSYSTLNQAYEAILRWIENNDYEIVGSNREFYIKGGHEQDNESHVTELQFPVAKR